MKSKTFPSSRTNVLLGPLREFVARKSYQPVDCDFTDELEHVSVLKIAVTVKHWTDDGKLISSQGLITNIITENKEEHLVISNRDRVRLDRIFEIQIVDQD